MPRPGRDTWTWKHVIKPQCFARDKANNAPCGICGQPIDYSLKPSSTPEAYEPDHRLPVDARPDLAEVPENIQASHRRCNRAKRNKAGVDNLGNRSRDWDA